MLFHKEEQCLPFPIRCLRAILVFPAEADQEAHHSTFLLQVLWEFWADQQGEVFQAAEVAEEEVRRSLLIH